MLYDPIAVIETQPRPAKLTRTRYRIALAISALVLFCTVVHRLMETPLWSLNGSRLMPSYELARGINFYVLQPPGGALYSVVYGPMFAITYLPATLFPSPNSAVLAGAAITVLLCFGAVAFLHFSSSETERSLLDWTAFLTAGFLVCYLAPLKYSCFNIHADGPGLAFGGIACGALYTARLEKWRWALPISALCAVLSCFSKQIFLPVPVALLAYLWVAEGRAVAARYFWWLLGLGGGATAAAAWAAGPANLYHCMVWLPAHHSWYGPSRLVSALQAARGFIRIAMPVPILLLACLAYFWTSERAGSRWRAYATQRCVPLLLAGILLLPSSIAGRAKSGGDVNSLSFALFFLTCGLTVMLADAARQAQTGATRRLAVAVLGATMVTLAISEAPLALDIPASAVRLSHSTQEVAFQYLTQRPGAAYFPWYPLSHFYAEHEFRHFAYGIVERLLGGEDVSQADFNAYTPRDPRLIVYGEDGTPQLLDFDLMRYMPEYKYKISDPELRGWQVFAKTP